MLDKTVMGNSLIPITPTARQAIFLTDDSLEVMYGGAARGGKSFAGLAAALQFADVPGYRALMLRRSYADLNLPEALIPMSHAWLQGRATWNGQHNEWTFPSGATLTFGYLQTEIDKYRYQGASLQFIFFDELTQFTESQYRYLFSRLCPMPGVPVPLRMRAASNPGGAGHDWVKKRFMPRVPVAGRKFIPAKLEDNPHIDTGVYETSLRELDPITRRQLRYGDWDVLSDGLFQKKWFRYWKREDDYYRLIASSGDRLVRVDECTRFLIADIAGTEKRKAGADPDYSVAQVWDLTTTGDLVLVDQWRAQVETPDTEDAIVRLVTRFDIPYIGVEHAHVGIGVISHLRRRGIAVRGIRAHRSKLVRSQSAQIRMEAGTVFFPDAPWVVEDLEPELMSFSGTGDEAHDDQADCVSYSAIHAQRMAGALRDDRSAALSDQRATAIANKDKAEVDEIESTRELALESAARARRGENAFAGFNEDDD